VASQTSYRHPFRWISESAEGRALALLAALLVLLSIALSAVGAALFSEAAPQGIVSYEFAGSAAGAERILGSWSAAAREHAMLSLGLDYLYLLVYPAFISLACVRVSRRLEAFRPGVARLGVHLSWAVLAAAPLDAIENAALIQLLLAGPSEIWARVAWWCAGPKFALVVLGLLFALFGYLVGRFAASSRVEEDVG
jgi:hypothetical protein